ncbi:MAG: hypothetical protein FWF69_01855 [Firmicutes bacterium]|nr:hypothetical protein [Bacillota bacterium]
MSCISISAYANASWDYLVTRPAAMLPVVIVMTLLIETYGIAKLNAIRKKGRVFAAVVLGNLVSFMVPQIPAILYDRNFTKTLHAAGPLYTIASTYYLITILFEMPVCYFLLRKHIDSKTRLMVTILLVNLVTTALVFAFERTCMSFFWGTYL